MADVGGPGAYKTLLDAARLTDAQKEEFLKDGKLDYVERDIITRCIASGGIDKEEIRKLSEAGVFTEDQIHRALGEGLGSKEIIDILTKSGEFTTTYKDPFITKQIEDTRTHQNPFAGVVNENKENFWRYTRAGVVLDARGEVEYAEKLVRDKN